MGRATRRYSVTVTHAQAPNPGAVQRGLDLWAAYLAERLGRPGNGTPIPGAGDAER